AVFQALRTVTLEEPDSAPIGSLDDLEILPEGRFLVVDRINSQLRVHDRDGRLQARIGRYGKGPGEFEDLVDAAVGPNGELYTMDFGSQRVSRFNTNLVFDTVLATVPGAGTHVAIQGDRVIVGFRGLTGFEINVGYLGESGDVSVVHPSLPDAAEMPYVAQIAVDHIAVDDSIVVLAYSVEYPMIRLVGEGLAKHAMLGDPPASWRPIVAPRAETFNGEHGRRNLASWLGTFAVVSGVHILDSMIVVSHGQYDADPTMQLPEMLRIHPYASDVYNHDGSKVVEDVVLRGRILSADSLLYVETAAPPEPRQITLYELNTPE
ncbi:MAG: 6-bladed beta-propeller, partial [Longimicrobiales bacterium]